MIKTLYIKNFALIDELEVQFEKGLNILTGETGAGKSIMIDAIDLAFGARASKDQIKTGENKAIIELQIQLSSDFPADILEENGIEPEENNILIISREISQTGTRSRINGVLVTQNIVQSLREKLIDIHSQHETYNYLHPKTHIDLLDSYGDSYHQNLLNDFTQIYDEYKQTRRELEEAKNQNLSKEQRLDFLKFQIDEIESAKIENPDEYDDLMQERLVLVNSEELKDLTISSYSSLYRQDNSIIDVLSTLENKLIKASEYDKTLSDIAEVIASSSVNLKDAADELRNYSENLEIDQERLNLIEERIDQLDKLKRKYGPQLSDILVNLEKFSHELSEIKTNSERIEALSSRLSELEKKLSQCAKNLSDSRKNLAGTLSDLIQRELIKLEMPKVQFCIKIDPKDEISSKGIDNTEFLISPNQGEPLKSLAKIASGGEISRVMLAIKTIFARADQVNTVIFDEIDSGISGKTSQAVAEELAGLACSHQILCITHQPIIAAMSDRYFYIEKIQSGNSTHSNVNVLNDSEKITAISKLASGSCEDQESLNFAAKLVNQAQVYKESLKKTVFA